MAWKALGDQPRSLIVWLVRHGETEDNGFGRYTGWSNPPLSPRGRRQAAELASRLVELGVKPRAIVASDLRRAWETAAPLSRTVGVPLVCDSALRELHMGSWTGLSYHEIMDRDPERARAWFRDPERVAPPGGETLSALRRRVLRALESAVEGAMVDADAGSPGSEPDLLIVSHAGPIRAAMEAWTGRPFWDIEVPSAKILSMRVGRVYFEPPSH